MIDHISLKVSDYQLSKSFYLTTLGPLGYALAMENPSGGGFAKGTIPDFWIRHGEPGFTGHVAFAAATRSEVDAFYKAAIEAGGTDNGPPGLRTLYHPNYYGAFVLDPDGNQIEAVCHKPE